MLNRCSIWHINKSALVPEETISADDKSSSSLLEPGSWIVPRIFGQLERIRGLAGGRGCGWPIDKPVIDRGTGMETAGRRGSHDPDRGLSWNSVGFRFAECGLLNGRSLGMDRHNILTAFLSEGSTASVSDAQC